MTVSQLAAENAHTIVPLLEQVQRLHVQAMPDEYTVLSDRDAAELFLREWLQDPNVTCLIYTETARPEGYLIYEIQTRGGSLLKQSQTQAMIHHICVDVDFRRMGRGKALIAAMRERLAETQVKRISAVHAAFNIPSAQLLASCGLKPTHVTVSGAL